MKKIAIVLSLLVFFLLNVKAGERDVQVNHGETYQEVLHVNSNCVISWKVGFSYSPTNSSNPGPGRGLAYFYEMQTGVGDELYYRSFVDGNSSSKTNAIRSSWDDVILYFYAGQNAVGNLSIDW